MYGLFLQTLSDGSNPCSKNLTWGGETLKQKGKWPNTLSTTGHFNRSSIQKRRQELTPKNTFSIKGFARPFFNDGHKRYRIHECNYISLPFTRYVTQRIVKKCNLTKTSTLKQNKKIR